MKSDEFEHHLSRQPFRQVPTGWREEILQAAAKAAPLPAPARTPTVPRFWLSEWLWPSPAAWGALAACWFVVFLLDRAAAPTPTELAEARVNSRLAVSYQAMLRRCEEAELTGEPRPASPVVVPRRSQPGQSQVWSNSSNTVV